MDLKKIKDFFAHDRFAQLTGVEIIEADKGYARTKLEITPQHLNTANVVQGGAIFTLADVAFAAASNSHGQLALAINVNISFLQGVSSGTLFAEATETCDPHRLGAYDILVTNEDRQIIARFNGIVYRKNEKNGLG